MAGTLLCTVLACVTVSSIFNCIGVYAVSAKSTPVYQDLINFSAETSSSWPSEAIAGRWLWKISRYMLEEATIILTLTQVGYKELVNATAPYSTEMAILLKCKRYQHRKQKFVKERLNILWCLTQFYHFESMKRPVKYVIFFWILINTYNPFSCHPLMEIKGFGVYNYLLIIFYMLLISGIELNPGPPKQQKVINEQPARKRVRKSGMKRYCNYLTERGSLENAPVHFKKIFSDESFLTQSKSLPSDHEQVLETTDVTTEKDLSCNHHELQVPGQLGDERSKHIHVSTSTYTCGAVNERPLCDSYIDDSSNSSVSSLSSDEDEDIALTSPSDSEHISSDDDSDEEISAGGLSEKFDDIPIYEGARISTGTSMLLHITYALEENLTGNGMLKLLNLTELHCKENNTIPTSLHIFKKWFKHLKIPPKKHMYCSSCLISIDNDMEKCPNTSCQTNFSKAQNKSYFVEIPILKQLQTLFYDKSFRDKLLFRFKREKKVPDNIEDIYDGQFYKSHEKILSNPNNISLIWNTDGIPLFKSSKVAMWPLYFSINELPFKIRSNPENMLLSGLWIGPKKPNMLTFLKPFIDDLEILENGVKFDTDVGNSIMTKGILIAGTADLPAKCAVCNMVQYNGQYSCPQCTQKGKTAASGKGRCHVFPFDFENPKGPKRSHEESLIMAETASENKNAVFGIKGPCWFTNLKYYNFVIGNCTDYMHCVLLGVTKRLTSFWFSKDFKGKEYNFHKSVGMINERIGKLKPPITIKRMPRSIDEMKYWKASEYRSWLLYYAPVLLIDILTKDYYTHFLLLSNAIYLLLKESISVEEVNIAENFIDHFVARYADLYEERFLTLNVHLLLHLPENVRQLGPLWAYSCFPFEDANGFLLKMIKGTQTVESQIMDTLSIAQGIPFLERESIAVGSREEDVLKKIKNLSLGSEYSLDEYTISLGKIEVKESDQLPPDYYISISNFLKKPLNGIVKLFKRIKKHGKIYHSLEYTRVRVRNSFTVKYMSSEEDKVCYGMVKTYAQYSEYKDDKQMKTNLAIILPLTETGNADINFPFDDVTQQRLMMHFVKCDSMNYIDTNPVAVDIQNIVDICIMMQIKSDNLEKVYLCCAPSLLEKD